MGAEDTSVELDPLPNLRKKTNVVNMTKFYQLKQYIRTFNTFCINPPKNLKEKKTKLIVRLLSLTINLSKSTQMTSAIQVGKSTLIACCNEEQSQIQRKWA